MTSDPLNLASQSISDLIVDSLEVGLFSVNRDMQILQWNRFMESHSGRSSDEVIGQNVFDAFPQLPRKWLEKKILSVFVIKNFAFTSWQDRPYLFRFPHGRPITGGIDVMQQNCTLMPFVGTSGQVECVCIALFDVTDIAVVQLQLEAALNTVRENANRDGLTGVYNRRHLEERLGEEFARFKRHGRELSLLLLDLDHFKQVNDRFGHLAGDTVLRVAAKRVADHIRQTDVFCRYGGEEFLLILPETTAAEAMVVAEKLRKAICETPFELDPQQLDVTLSIGASAARSNVASPQQLIEEADRALYAAKAQGRNRCIAFEAVA